MLRTSILVLLITVPLTKASAVEVKDLYRAETIVTGKEEPERTRGFRSGLIDVVVKLTGDARLAENAALKPLIAKPHDLVERFEYEDRMKGIPVHDEQGTRERPHYLRMLFKAAEIDGALHQLDLRKWSADRPLLAVWLGVQTALGRYVLRASGDQGYGQRAVFEQTARRRGIPIFLPPKEAQAPSITFDDLTSRDIDKLVTASPGADAILLGTLILSQSGYWDIQWLLHWKGRSNTWGHQGITFDAAIKDGLQRSALVFSGNLRE